MAVTEENVRNLRAGAYGDPSNIPYKVWAALYGYDEVTGTARIRGTGYTKEWMTCDQRMQRFFMASCSEEWEHDLAKTMGWRVYEIISEVEVEYERGVDCNSCLLCNGTMIQAKDIAIPAIRNRKVCYVEVEKSVDSTWKKWKRGNTPQVSLEVMGDYLAGVDVGDNFKSVELWRGASPVDNEPIVLIATGASRKEYEQSQNTKTGTMVQTYILKQDEKPSDAVKSGGDESICGKCPLRPILAKKIKQEV